MHRRLPIALCTLFAALACNGKGSAPSGAAASAAPPIAAPPVASASGASPTPAAPKVARPAGPLNVLLLTVDSLRADRVAAGYERDVAPELTKLAAESTVYTNAYSVSSYTAKSVGALLSGQYPSALYRDGWFFTGYSKSNLFFTEVLQDGGVRTMAAHAHMYFKRGKNLEQGFDVWETVPGITFDPNTDNHVTSEKTTTVAIDLLKKDENTSKPFFLWLHYMDPHDVYVKHKGGPDFGSTNKDRYDSEVLHTDSWIGKLLDHCRTQPWWDKTVVIVSADHGEAFGEHGMYKHAFEIWEVLVRVPLIIRAPGAKPQRIAERRSQLDLAPTIVELQGAKPSPTFVGKSLVPELYGEKKPDIREPIVLELPEDSHNPPRRALISGKHKLIVHGAGWKYSLYDLSVDPGETKDLAKTDPETLATMKALYATTTSSIPSVAPYGGMKLKGGASANGPMGPAPVAP